MEHALVTFSRARAGGAIKGSDCGEGSQRRGLTPAHVGLARDMEADQTRDPGGCVRFGLRRVEHAMQGGEACFKAGDRQLLLPGEIVGHAGCPQADQFGHGRQVHAVEALVVEDGDCGRDDVGAAALEPVAWGRCRCLILGFPCHDTYASRATRNRFRSLNREFSAAAIIRKSRFCAMNRGLTKNSACWLEPCSMVSRNHQGWTP